MRSTYVLRKVLGSVRNVALFVLLLGLFPAIAAVAIYLVEGEDTRVTTLTTSATLPETGDGTSVIGSNQNQKITVNAQLQVMGQLRLTPTSLPDDAVAGTLVFDQSTSTLQYFNGTEFVILTAQNAQTGQVVNIFNTGVSSISGQEGSLAIQGTVNRVSVSVSNGVISLSTPQDLHSAANVLFNSVTLGGQLQANSITNTSLGNDILINAGADGIVFTDGNRNFIFPSDSDAIQEICTDSGNCGPGGSGGVTELNGMSGNLTIQGTADQVNVMSAADIITLSTPQDIATTSSPTFNILTLTGDLAVNGGDITTSSLTANVFNSGVTTLGIGTSATTINLGTDAVAKTINIGSTTTTSTLNLYSGTGGIHLTGSGTNADILITTVSSGSDIRLDAQEIELDANGALKLGDTAANSVTIGPTANDRTIDIRGTTTIRNNVNPNVITLQVRSAAGQAANIQEWQSSGSAVLASISSAGNFMTTGTGNIAGNLTVDTNTLFVDASNNRVGIGTLTPATALGVVGDGRFSGRLQVGAVDTIDQCTTVFTIFTPATCDAGIDATNSSDGTIAAFGSLSQLAVTALAASSVNNIGSYNSLTIAGSQNYTGSSNVAMQADAISLASGSVASITGSLSRVVSSSSLTLGTAIQGIVSSSSGSIATARGLYLQSNTGTITNNYGAYIDNQTVGTNDYGLYIAGADTYSLWVDSGVSRFDGNLEFEGSTDDSFETTLTVADPTADNSITIPNASGTICLTSGNCAGVGGTGDVLNGGNTVAATMTIGTNNSFGLGLETVGTTRLSIDTSGNSTFSGNIIAGAGTLQGAATGLTITGGSNSATNLTLQSTSNATRGTIDMRDQVRIITENKSVSTSFGFVDQVAIGSGTTLTVTNNSAFRGVLFNPTVVYDTPIFLTGGRSFEESSTLKNPAGAARTIPHHTAFYSVTTTQADGAAVTSHRTGFLDAPIYSTINGGTLTAQNHMGFESQLVVNSGATVVNRYGFQVDAADLTGGGAMTNQWGLHIANLTGATNDYGIYVGGADTYALWIDSGTSRFDGNLRVEDASLTVTNGSDRLFVVDNANDRIGIGVPSWATLDYSYQAFLNASTTQAYASYQHAQLGGSTTVNQTAYLFNMGFTNPATTSFLTHTNVQSFMSFDLTANTANNNFVGIDTSGYISGSGTAENITGNFIHIGPAANSTIYNLYGLRVQNGSGSGATIANHQGIRIDNLNSGGTVTDNYALYIQNQTTGTNDYGLYIQGADTYALFVDDGASRLDGTLTVGSTITYTSGSADTADHVCRNAAGQLAGCTSASRFKNDVSDLSLGLDELRLLQPVSFTWNTTGKADIGFLAEQVASVIPQAVTYDEFGEISSFNYNTISALLVSSTKQLDLKVSSMESRLASVEQGNFTSLNISGNLRVHGLAEVQSLRINGKIITGGNIPTISYSEGSSSVSGNDTAGTLSFSPDSISVQSRQVTINFTSAFSTQPRVTVTPTSDKSGAIRYYVERTNAGFTIRLLETPEVGSTYSFDYQVMQ